MTTPTCILLWITFLSAAGLIHVVLLRNVFCKSCSDSPKAATRTVKQILVIAALLRIPFLFMDPPLSDDVWRNLWDGRVQVAGMNPYRYGPLDDDLAALRDDTIWHRINHPQYRTIYPPLGQMSAAAAAALSVAIGMPPLWAWKMLVVAVELAGMAMLGRALAHRGNLAPLAIWAWSPLAVIEFAGGGHIDGIALGLSGATAALWLRERHAGAGALFAGAVMTKFLPFPAGLGFVGAKGSGRAALAFLVTAVLLTIPYIAAGPRIVEQLGVYAGNWEFNGVLNRWLRIDSWGYTLAALPGAGVTLNGIEKGTGRLIAWIVVLAAGFIAARRGTEPFLVARRTLALFLAIQPTIYPWYLANLLPWLCLSPSWSVAVWLAISPLSYEVLSGRAATGVWHENHFIQGAVFGLAGILFVVEYLMGRRRHV
jgi:hypothetical protein